MIKRTFTTTTAVVIGINIETEIAEKREIILRGKNISTRDILKKAKTDDFTPSHVKEVTTAVKTFEITEEDFLAKAKEVQSK